MTQRPLIGTTYSHPHTGFLKGLTHDEVFPKLLDLHFDLIRIGCYWSEIEPEKNQYTVSSIRHLLELCEQRQQKVVLVVGMKSPQDPEFHFPRWLPEKTPEGAVPFVFDFLTQTVISLRDFSCISAWQVENESFDPSGPSHFTIPQDVLIQEIALVKKLDAMDRPIVLTLWGNELTRRGHWQTIQDMADVVGLDIYYKVPGIGPLYFGPLDSDRMLRTLIGKSLRPVWITELQAEPWERSKGAALSEHPRSISPGRLQSNIDRALSLEPEAIFLWGFEYWLMKKMQGDSRMWETVEEILGKREN